MPNRLCWACREVFESQRTSGIHHRSWSDLKRAARASAPCYICNAVIRVHYQDCADEPEDYIEVVDPKTGLMSHQFTTYSKPVKFEGKVKFFLPYADPGGRVEELIFQLIEADPRLEAEIDLPKGQPSFHRYSDKTYSPFMRQQVEKWMHECLNNHATCNTASKRDYMPSRLLEIGEPSSDEVRLWIQQEAPDWGSNHPYMTLSHRWEQSGSGGQYVEEQASMLTKDTMAQLRKGIRVDTLPNTWQDAIFVAGSLGARFLWIDSLCIIQKSPNDFYKEAKDMADIYGNSWCNITAIGANGNADGCLYRRVPFAMKPCKIRLGPLNSPKDYYLIPSFSWVAEVDYRPLQQRGWVFQEVMLAPRILHLGQQQIYWQCHRVKACEVFPGGIPDFMENDDIPSLSRLIQDKSSHLNKSDAQDAWKKMLMTYTRLELTESGDKLVALAGIIKRLEDILEDECLAGLWRRSFVPQLLWRPSRERASTIMTEHPRPDYRAPTWSWASTDREIEPGPFSEYQNYAEIHRVNINGTNILSRASNHGHFFSGQIRQGYIVITGILMTAELVINVIDAEDTIFELIVNKRPQLMSSEDMAIDVREDYDGSHVMSIEPGRHNPGVNFIARLKLLCLVIRILPRPSKDTKGVECLLLRETDAFGEFERYGYANLSEYSIHGDLGGNWYDIENDWWFPKFVRESSRLYGAREIVIR